MAEVTLAALDRQAEALGARVVTRQTLDSLTRIAYDKGWKDGRESVGVGDRPTPGEQKAYEQGMEDGRLVERGVPPVALLEPEGPTQ